MKRSILYLVIILILMVGCSQNNESPPQEVPFESPEIKRDANLGSVMPIIVYESESQVIFYNYMGIFIYDLNNSKMINAFKPLDSEFTIQTQGDNATLVDFNLKENTLTIYQVGNQALGYFYEFDINSNTLYQQPIENLPQKHEDHEISGEMNTKDWTSENLIYTSKLTGKSYYPFRSIIESENITDSETNEYYYEPNISVIEGTLITRLHYGPPRFGEDPENDEEEYPFILQLDTPIDVITEDTDTANLDKFDVLEVQLVLRGEPYLDIAKQYKNKYIKVKGTFFIAFTGHHHTEVLMVVDEFLD